METQEMEEQLRAFCERNSPPFDGTAFLDRLRKKAGGGRRQASAPRRMSSLRLVLYASLAVVLVAAITVGSLEAVKHLGKDQPILVITDDTTGVSPGSTAETSQTTATTAGSVTTAGSATPSAGGRWERLSSLTSELTSEGGPVIALVIDPQDPLKLYAANFGFEGLSRSTDGAESWERLSPIEAELGVIEWVTLIAVDPAHPATIYVTAWSSGLPQLFRSDDAGESWVDLSRAWDADPPNMEYGVSDTVPLTPGGGFRMWFDPTSNPSTVYLAGHEPETAVNTVVWRSTDQGETWIMLSSEEAAQVLPTEPETGAATDFQGPVTDADTGAVLDVFVGRIQPTDPSIRYAGTEEGMYKSTDGGTTWRKATATLTTTGVGKVVPDPSSPSILYVTTPQGIFKSGDGGINWSLILAGEGSLVMAPSSPSTLYAWTRAGLFRTDDGGADWTELAGTGLAPRPETGVPSDDGDDGLVLVAIDDPDTVFALSGPELEQLYRSTDGGNTWSLVLDGTTAVVADPEDTSTLFAATHSGETGQVLKSTDRGATWTIVGPAGQWEEGGIGDLAVVGPHPPTTIYVIQGREDGPDQLLRSLDGGATWEKVDTPRFEGLPDDWLSSPSRLLFDPRSPNTLYLLVLYLYPNWVPYSDLFRSTDGGSTWQSILREPAFALEVIDAAGQVDLRSIVVDPAPGGGLYAFGGDSGLFKWTPGGE